MGALTRGTLYNDKESEPNRNAPGCFYYFLVGPGQDLHGRTRTRSSMGVNTNYACNTTTLPFHCLSPGQMTPRERIDFGRLLQSVNERVSLSHVAFCSFACVVVKKVIESPGPEEPRDPAKIGFIKLASRTRKASCSSLPRPQEWGKEV